MEPLIDVSTSREFFCSLLVVSLSGKYFVYRTDKLRVTHIDLFLLSHRHLMNDLETILPHAKKDSKLDSKSHLHILNELAELSNCNNCIFFEVRKRQDLYMWISKTPNGPSAKLHVQNIHTMDELKLTGNSLKGSRHILSFDKNFDSAPHFQLLKEMFTQVYGVPKGSRRSKPFIDHVLSFSIVDNRIWFRNYQVSSSICMLIQC